MLNKVQVIGHLGNDPEVKYLQNGDCVCNFSVAATERWKDSNGDQQERTEWFRIVAWRKLGEVCGEYLAKGKLAYVEGKLQTRKWTDDNGVERYSTEVVASEVKFLSPRDGERGDRPAQRGGGGSNERGGAQRSAPARQAPRDQPGRDTASDEFSDDDLPF